MLTLATSQRRVRRFLLIGTLCFGTQYAIMRILVAIGMSWPAASVVGFTTSAQFNFVLSNAITWGERRRSGPPLWLRWLSYCATSLLGLAVNTAVFAVAYRPIGSLPATASAVVAASIVTYLLCNFVVFRPPATPSRATPSSPVSTVAPVETKTGEVQ